MEIGDGGGEIDCRRLDSAAEGEEMEAAVPPSVRKRKMEDQLEEEEEEEEEEDIISACVIRGSKHADGSIYRQDTHFCHRLYRLDDSHETFIQPTILVDPVTKKIIPTEDRYLTGCALMQIFSLKLANHSAIAAPAAGPIMLYGFVAARDLLQPLRNYVFNRTRDDPLVLRPDDPTSPLTIQMAGPKRGIYLQARAMIEYDVKVKRATEAEDLQLIDGAATFSELTAFHGTYTQRIHGDHGAAPAAVDITLALLRHAVEARIEVSVTKVPAAGLSFSMSCYSSRIMHEINLFDGVVDRPGNIKRSNNVKSFLVAVVHKSPLILCFKVAKAGDAQNGGGAGQRQTHMRGYPAQVRGQNWDSIPLDFGAIDVHISWSSLE